MPFVSRAQQAWAHAAADRGEFPKKSLKEFDKATKGKDLPEHVRGKAHGGEIICPHCGRGTGYADGGEIPDSDLGRKPDAVDTGIAINDPDYQLPVYRGENAKAEAQVKQRQEDADFAQAVSRQRRSGRFQR